MTPRTESECTNHHPEPVSVVGLLVLPLARVGVGKELKLAQSAPLAS